MTYFFRMSVGACAVHAQSAIRVLFLYWATHNVLSSILPFIMNAVSPFKCSHKHTADKNLIKCRLKPNRKTHSLIIFYHVPWSYPPHTFHWLVLPWATAFQRAKSGETPHTSRCGAVRLCKMQNEGAVTRLIRNLMSGEDWGVRGREEERQRWREGISCLIPKFASFFSNGQSQHCRQGESYLSSQEGTITILPQYWNKCHLHILSNCPYLLNMMLAS